MIGGDTSQYQNYLENAETKVLPEIKSKPN